MDEIYSFGDWVRRRRRALDLTQKELARRVGCAAVTVRKIERDERRPSTQMAQLLADQLAVPDALRADFVRLGRGEFVTISPPASLRLPPFLADPDGPPRRSPAPFVAREQALATLDRHLASALGGHGRLLFVTGEAGRGKTSLLVAFARRTEASFPELIVVHGRGHTRTGAGDPYLPFRDILGLLTGDLEAPWRAGELSRAQAQRLWALIPTTLQAIAMHGPDLVDTLLSSAALRHRLAPYLEEGGAWLDQLQPRSLLPRPAGQKMTQGQLWAQITQVLLSVAARQPLLVLLDDLQWIDDASCNLVFYLGRRLAGSRLLLLGAYRSSEVALGRAMPGQRQPEPHPLAPLVHELRRYFGEISIDLDPGPPAQERAFVDALLDSEPNQLHQAFRDRLFARTGGHPLFTVELLRSMAERGELVQDANGQWQVGLAATNRALPARVEAVIAQRLDRLDETARAILSVASVEGTSFTAQVVARALDTDITSVLRRLREDLARRHRLVQAQAEVRTGAGYLSRYRFSHVLFQETLYDRLSQAERRLLHGAVGQALVTLLGASPAAAAAGTLGTAGPALVDHFWQAELWPLAASYAVGVGQHALRVFALREALAHFERAVQALDQLAAPNHPDLFDALLLWQEAAFALRPYEEQLDRLARAETIARQLDDRRKLVTVLHRTANVHLARGLWTRAGPSLMACLSLVAAMPDEQLAVRPTYYYGLMTTFVSPRAALPLLAQARALAARHGDAHIEALALGTGAQMHAQLGEFGQAHSMLSRARLALAETQSPLTESDVDLLAAWTYLAMGDTGRGLAYSQRSVARARATDNIECICSGLDCVGFNNLELQRIPPAGVAFAEAIARSRASGAMISRVLGEAGLAMTRFCQGETAAVDDLASALAAMEAVDNRVGAATAAQLLGSCLLQAGQPTRAETYLVRACDFYRQAEMRPYLMRALPVLAELYAATNRDQRAAAARTEAAALQRALAAAAPGADQV